MWHLLAREAVAHAGRSPRQNGRLIRGGFDACSADRRRLPGPWCVGVSRPRRGASTSLVLLGSLGSLTYRELDARARGMALALEQMGVGQGERVAIVSPNSAKFMITLFGVSAFGRVCVPVNFRLNAEEVTYIVEHSGRHGAAASTPRSTPTLAGVAVQAPHRARRRGRRRAVRPAAGRRRRPRRGRPTRTPPRRSTTRRAPRRGPRACS